MSCRVSRRGSLKDPVRSHRLRTSPGCQLPGNYTECRISTLCYHLLSGHHRGTAGKRDSTRHPHEAGKPGGSVTRTAAAPSAPTTALELPERLRAETAQWHREVEALADIPSRVRTRADYTDVLVRLFELHVGLETQLSEQVWDRAWVGVGVNIAAHCRAGLLVTDLDELGVALPTSILQQPFSCFGEAIGCLYVLEGSAIGGRIVAGMV